MQLVKTFRKHKKVAFALLTLMAMISFVILPHVLEIIGSRASKDVLALQTKKYGNLHRSELDMLSYQRQKVLQVLEQLATKALGDRDSQGNIDFQAYVAAAKLRSQIGGTSDEEVAVGWLLANRAQEIGVLVSDDSVKAQIGQLLVGKIKKKDLDAVLKSAQISATQFVAFLRHELLSLEMRNMLLAGAGSLSPTERWDCVLRLHRNAKIEALPLPVANYVAQVKQEPSSREIKDLFNQYRHREPNPNSPEPGFREPARAAVAYFRLDQSAFLDSSPEGEKRIEAYYQEHLADFIPKPPAPDQTIPFVQPKPEVKPEAKPAEAKPAQPAAQPKPEAKPEVKPAETPKPEVKPEPKPAEPPKPEVKPEPKPEVKPEPKPEVKPEAKPAEAKPAQPVAPPKPEVKPEPKPAEPPKPEAKPEPKPAETPKPEVKPEPKPAAKTSSVSRSPFQYASYQAPPTEPGQTAKTEPTAPAPAAPAPAPVAGAKPAAPAPVPAAVAKPAEAKPAEPAKPQPRPLSEVREEIRRILAAEDMKKILDQLQAKLQQFETKQWLRYQTAKDQGKDIEPPTPPDFQALAEAYNTNPARPKVLAVETGVETLWELRKRDIARSGIPNGKAFLEVIFEGTQVYRPLVTMSEGSAFLFWKTEDIKAREMELTDEGVRQRVIDAWKFREARKLALADAKQMAEKAAQSGKPLQDLFGESGQVVTPREFTWMSVPAEIPRVSEVEGIDRPGDDFMRAVFSLQPTGVDAAMNHPQDVAYVIRLVQFSPSADQLWDLYTKAEFAAGSHSPYAKVDEYARQQVFMAQIDRLKEQAGLQWLIEPRRPRRD